MHLPPESAWARAHLGGITDPERLAVGLLHLAHTQMAIAAVSGGMKPRKVPKVTDFLPAMPSEEREKPRDFAGWAAALLPMVRG